VQEGRRDLAQAALHRRQQAYVPQRATDDVATGAPLHQGAPGDQLADEAVGGGERDPAAVRQLGQGQAGMGVVERAQDGQHPLGH